MKIISKFSYQYKNQCHPCHFSWVSLTLGRTGDSFMAAKPHNASESEEHHVKISNFSWETNGHWYVYVYTYPLQKTCRTSCGNLVYTHRFIESCHWFESHHIESLYFINLKCFFILEEKPLFWNCQTDSIKKNEGFFCEIHLPLGCFFFRSVPADKALTKPWMTPKSCSKKAQFAPVANVMLSHSRWSKHCRWPPWGTGFARSREMWTSCWMHLHHMPSWHKYDTLQFLLIFCFVLSYFPWVSRWFHFNSEQDIGHMSAHHLSMFWADIIATIRVKPRRMSTKCQDTRLKPQRRHLTEECLSCQYLTRWCTLLGKRKIIDSKVPGWYGIC